MGDDPSLTHAFGSLEQNGKTGLEWAREEGHTDLASQVEVSNDIEFLV